MPPGSAAPRNRGAPSPARAEGGAEGRASPSRAKRGGRKPGQAALCATMDNRQILYHAGVIKPNQTVGLVWIVTQNLPNQTKPTVWNFQTVGLVWAPRLLTQTKPNQTATPAAKAKPNQTKPRDQPRSPNQTKPNQTLKPRPRLKTQNVWVFKPFETVSNFYLKIGGGYLTPEILKIL